MMQIMRNKLVVVSLIAILGVVGLWVFQQQSPSVDQTVKIGVLLPLTGGAASYGENSRRGAALALEAFLEEHPDLNVELVVEDSRGEAAQGVRAAQKLVNIDRVVAVVGCVTSGVTLAVAPIMNESQVPIVSTGASAPGIRDAGDYVFRTWPSDVYEAEMMARYLAESQIERLAILRVNNEYGLAMERALIQRLSPATQVVVSESFEQGALEMRTQLFKIRDVQPDGIYFIGFPEAAVVFGSSLSTVGLQIPVFATSAFEDPQIPDRTGGVLNGTVYTKPLAESPAVDTFRQSYSERYGNDSGITSDTAYDATKLVLNALASIVASGDTLTGQALRDHLLQVQGYAGASGMLSFDEEGDVVKPVGMFVLNNNQFEVLAR